MKDRILSVSKQVTRIDGELVVTEPKTKNSVRKVALSQQAVALLVQEHEQHPDSPLLFPSPPQPAGTGVRMRCPGSTGNCWRRPASKSAFASMICAILLPRWALSSGVDVKTLSSMLGHYSAGFTLDTYTHITKRYAKRRGGEDRRLHGNGHSQAGTGAA